jgi:Chaperone of endosialidase
VTLDLGGTYSNTAGANMKLVLWDGGSGAYGSGNFGIGISSNEQDYVVPTSGTQHAFWVGSTDVLQITSTGAYITGKETVTGAVTLSGLTTGGSGQKTLCINSSTGVLSYYGSNTCTDSSDIRLKRDIVTLPDESGLNAIMKLRPVRFHWKDVKQDAEDGEQIGLIAQEVEPVFPASNMTSINGDATIDLGGGKTEKIDAVHAVNYDRLTVPLIKAVQELKAANDNLRAANDNQARQLKALNDRIEKLEAAHH